MHRALDKLGRIVVPMEYRKQLGLVCGDEMDISMEHHKIMLTPVKATCALCEGAEHIETRNGYSIGKLFYQRSTGIGGKETDIILPSKIRE